MQNENPSIEKQYQTLVIIWFALLVSQVLFLGVVYFAKPEVYKFDFSRPFFGENFAIAATFAILALSVVALSFVLKAKFYNRAINEQKPALVQTGLVVAVALCEAASLFGLVLAFAFSFQYFFLWIALGILGVILHFPRRDSLFAAAYEKN